jgi:hypothetical protein
LPFGLGLIGLAGLAVYGGRRWWLRMHPQENAGQLSRAARERIVHDSRNKRTLQFKRLNAHSVRTLAADKHPDRILNVPVASREWKISLVS